MEPIVLAPLKYYCYSPEAHNATMGLMLEVLRKGSDIVILTDE